MMKLIKISCFALAAALATSVVYAEDMAGQDMKGKGEMMSEGKMEGDMMKKDKKMMKAKKKDKKMMKEKGEMMEKDKEMMSK